MRIYERFWNRIASWYSRQPVADEAAYQEKLRKTREFLSPDSVVFEFGCGTGSTALSHAPYVRSIAAIDVSSRMIEIAREKAGAAGLDNVTFDVASIEDFVAPEAAYDVVMAHSILHLLKDQERALAKSYSMLKPGGALVTSTICMGDHLSTRIIGFLVASLSWIGVLPYINSASSKVLASNIRNAGFEIEHEWRPKEKAALFLIALKR